MLCAAFLIYLAISVDIKFKILGCSLVLLPNGILSDFLTKKNVTQIQWNAYVGKLMTLNQLYF